MAWEIASAGIESMYKVAACNWVWRNGGQTRGEQDEAESDSVWETRQEVELKHLVTDWMWRVRY